MRGITRALIFMLMLCLPLPAALTQEGVTLVSLNIGKADCHLLLTGESAFLIDTGYDYTYPALEAMLRHYDISQLDAVFLTHCHADHEGGLMALSMSDVEIGAWYCSPHFIDVKEGRHPAVLAAQARGEAAVFLSPGQVLTAGGGAAFTILGPLSLNTDNENNNSLVMRFDSPHGSILFAGDMKEEEEEELLSARLLAPVDILKAGHHGDSGATTAALLHALTPKTVLISTLTFEETDTPARSTLSRIRAVNAQAYVTQDADSALETRLLNGRAFVESVTFSGLPDRAAGLTLSIDVKNDILSIRNPSITSVNLTGFALVSTRGSEWFSLQGIVPPGDVFTIGTKTSDIPCDLILPEKRVWHKSKRDAALLYDAFGRLVSMTDNGMSE